MASGTTGAPPAAPTAAPRPRTSMPPSRAELLLRDRKRLLIALALLALAAAIAIGTSAVFTSSAANPSNTFTAGTLTINNDKEGLGDPHRLPDAAGRQPERPGDDREQRRLRRRLQPRRQRPHRYTGGRRRRRAVDRPDAADRRPGRRREPGGGDDAESTTARSTPCPPSASEPGAAGESHPYEFTVTFPDSGLPPQRDDRRQRVPGSRPSGDLQLDRRVDVAVEHGAPPGIDEASSARVHQRTRP